MRRLVYPLHERLKGKRTLAWLARVERSQWLDPAALRELQLSRLREHLAFARDHVPYYRRLFAEHGIRPERIASLDDFRRVPYLTRDVLRARFADLRAAARLRGVQRLATGGSSGAPVSVLVDAERMAIGDAFRLRAHRWFGVEPGDREVVLWGAPFELNRQDRLRALRDRLLNSRLLSAFQMTPAALDRYGEAIARDRPRKMYGYASALYLLARHLRVAGWTPPRELAAVFTTAEPLLDVQRRTIAEVFGCRVATEYGSRDAGLTANECPEGGLHVPVEGIVVELADVGADGVGEIVVTNLYSPAMPIIRYRTGDLGRLEPQPCRCGRTLPRLASVEGRSTDFLVTPDGRVMHALAVIYVLRETPGVGEFQVEQESVTRVTVRIVPDGAFTRADRARLLERLGRVLGDEVGVEIDEVALIPPGPGGKFRHVVSRVAGTATESLVAAGGAAGPAGAPRA
ncbi:MAG TPA: phenylacetate--CoA ligase family protein [Candidatus Tectomicrobia bacterium]|nr:phenylacetate--CoA ligase family protein [Candidatus Tectomicrobia bacterium]